MKRASIELDQKLGASDSPARADRFGQAIRAWASKTVTRPIRTLSLFSGAGGLDIGFHDAGFDIQTMIEVKPQFVKTLEANCGKSKYFENGNPICKDIRKYRVPKDMKVDFIIGGPPCQPFSAAGRRMAGVRGTTDKQGALFGQYVRLLKKLSPQGFLFENVYGLLGAEGGKAWRKIKHAFENAGYKVFFRVIDTADFGVPQHRKRVFIVGTKDANFLFPRPTHGPDSPNKKPYITAEEAISGIQLTRAEKKARVNGKYGKLLKDIPAGLNYSFYTEKMGHPRPIFAWRSKFYDFLYKADPKAPIRTLKAQGGQYTGPFHWRNRRFAVAELKRLQTFPDAYELTGGLPTVVEQIGNSVAPQLARLLALAILNQVFGIEIPFDLPLLADNQSLDTRQRKPVLTSPVGERAKAAINRIKQSHIARRPRKRSYTAVLSENFGWTFLAKHEAALHIAFVPSNEAWAISVSAKSSRKNQGFEIVVTPNPALPWGLEVPQVVLTGTEVTPRVFTGVWKAFELELFRLGIKADLVQLSGYYQYPPTFQCAMSFNDKLHGRRNWKVVSCVVAGVGVGEILSHAALGNLWHVAESKVLHYAIYLRGLGYEVRNSNTNPQIPEGHILIPYAFPTLNQMSVQLHKSLEKIYGEK